MSLCQVVTFWAYSAPEPSVAARRTVANKLRVTITRSFFTIPPRQLQFESSIGSPPRDPKIHSVERNAGPVSANVVDCQNLSIAGPQFSQIAAVIRYPYVRPIES